MRRGIVAAWRLVALAAAGAALGARSRSSSSQSDRSQKVRNNLS